MQVFEEIPWSKSTLMENTERGKGLLTSNNVVMACSEMSFVAHEFATLLQFGTSFEIMEFLATQQIKVSQCMDKEHMERQMIERALAGIAKREDECASGKIRHNEEREQRPCRNQGSSIEYLLNRGPQGVTQGYGMQKQDRKEGQKVHQAIA